MHLPHVNLQTMLERQHKGVLSLNLKKLASGFDDLKITFILQNEMLLLILMKCC